MRAGVARLKAQPQRTLLQACERQVILDPLNGELVRIVNLPEVRGRLNAMAFTVGGSGRAAFASSVKAEFARWGRAVRDSGAGIE